MLNTAFLTIFDGYLNSAAARTAGMPATAVCPVIRMDSQAERPDPALVLTVDEAGDARQRQIVVAVTMRSAKPRSVTDAYLDAVRQRLRDQGAFYEHLRGVDVALRTGWHLEAITYPAPANVRREDDGTTETSVGMVLHLILPL